MAEFKCPSFKDRSGEWVTHKRDMQTFFLAAGLSDASQERKVAMLLYSLGSKYQTVFENFGLTEEHKKVYQRVITKFDEYFQPTKLTKLNMKRFEDRYQGEESISEYISSLRDIAALCDFGATLERQLCKQISVGVKDKALRDKLWSED